MYSTGGKGGATGAGALTGGLASTGAPLALLIAVAVAFLVIGAIVLRSSLVDQDH